MKTVSIANLLDQKDDHSIFLTDLFVLKRPKITSKEWNETEVQTFCKNIIN
jgi:hypothetical protein